MDKKNRNNTFRFPFDIDRRIFLFLSVVFFILSIDSVYDGIFPKNSIDTLRNKIELNLNKSFAEFQKTVDSSTEDYNSLYPINPELVNYKPYGIFVYQNDELIQWNKNDIKLPNKPFDTDNIIIFKNLKGYYAIKTIEKKNSNGKIRLFTCIIPIKEEYQISSDNFINHFINGDKENDYGITISLNYIKNSIPVRHSGKILFYLHKEDFFISINDQSGWRLFFNALPFIFFGISIHTYFKVSVKNNPKRIFNYLLLVAFIVRSSNYLWGFPSDYSYYTLFNPMFFATDYINKSLGDVFINTCLLFWILLFYIVNVQGRYLKLKESAKSNIFLPVIFISICIAQIYIFDLAQKIIDDSIIIFDTTLFTRLDLFSFVGLLTLMILFANIFLLTILCNNYFNDIVKNRNIKIYFYAFATILIIVLFRNASASLIFLFPSIGFISFLLDKQFFKLRFDFNSYPLLLWLIIIAILSSLILTYKISEKENTDNIILCSKVTEIYNNVLEEELASIINNINNDSDLLSLSKNTFNIELVSKSIQDNYLFPKMLKYNTSIHTISPYNIPNIHDYNFSKFLNQNFNNEFTYNFSNESYFVQPYINNNDKGYIACILKTDSISYFLKVNYPLLNIQENYKNVIFKNPIQKSISENQFSVAIYKDNILVNKIGNFAFPEYLNATNLYKEKNSLLISLFNKNDRFFIGPTNSMGYCTIIHKKNTNLYLFTTLFAYIFLIYFIVISLYIFGNILARSNLNYDRFLNLINLNLRLRIQIAILAIVLASFIVVGYSTSRYLVGRIKENNHNKLTDYNRKILKDFNYIIQDNNFLKNNTSPDPIAEIELSKTANRYNSIINLYSTKGKLLYSSDPTIFQSQILSEVINPIALYNLNEKRNNFFITDNNFGKRHFLSIFTFVKDNNSQISGILEIPYLLSKTEIEAETTSLLTSLVNIYVLVFLLSSVLALFITNSVTRPFNYIVKQFTKINLSKTNQPLTWQYSDEIGLLVKEYNRMLRKLENSTQLLAKTEREMAWREMAKQVAHEIKNPLTPMKLSLQMLERAINNNNPNVTEITSRVSKTLIEQIDNLSLIATNFSNFAKLPEMKKEYFKLNDILFNVTGMYNDNNNFEYLFLIPEHNITIFADKSQLIRVFTNIIQNATQAIAPDQKGNISLVVSKIKNNFVRITITDNGMGIDDDTKSKLFQPYFTTKSSGTGLGLAMCKDIIEEFDGRITFESTLGNGSSFFIDLPIVDV